MGPRTVLAALVCAVASFLSALPAMAGETRPLAVVELFTSQGCTSCPPADKVLAELADGGDVIALSYHIDYWDYLGWRDTLGKPENTERQRAYARALGAPSVYTPQAVVNGRAHMNGAKRRAILNTVEAMAANGEAPAVDLTIARSGESLIIEAGPAVGAERRAHLMLVYFRPQTVVAIERGKNHGKTLAYRNSVTGFQAAGMWRGTTGRWEIPAVELDRKDGRGCAVLLQATAKDGTPGAILGAAVLEAP